MGLVVAILRYGFEVTSLLEVSESLPSKIDLFCAFWVHQIGGVPSAGRIEYEVIGALVWLQFLFFFVCRQRSCRHCQAEACQCTTLQETTPHG